MDRVTSILVDQLDRELRIQILRRREAMLRELRFLEEREDPSLLSIRRSDWTNERLEVLCGLNAFYQLVLGPLASSSRDRFGELGREIPIQYGELLRFDAERSRRLRRAHMAFMVAIGDVPDVQGLLTAPQFRDMVFRLARHVEENGRG